MHPYRLKGNKCQMPLCVQIFIELLSLAALLIVQEISNLHRVIIVDCLSRRSPLTACQALKTHLFGHICMSFGRNEGRRRFRIRCCRDCCSLALLYHKHAFSPQPAVPGDACPNRGEFTNAGRSSSEPAAQEEEQFPRPLTLLLALQLANAC